MAEYIERSEALDKCGWYNTVNGKSICAVRKDELAAIPAADVVEVRHGRWVWNEENECWRGIKVCEEWHEASNFILWALNNGYERGLQLDRIDNDGDYCPENCRFVTPKENSRNRRNTKRLTVNGETKTVAEWCEQLGLNQNTVYDWIRKKGIAYAEQRTSEIA